MNNKSWSTAAEQNVIGAAMLDNAIISRCALKPSDFFNTRHQVIWESVLRLYAKREVIDAITVTEELERSRRGDCGIGIEFLAKLCHETASPSNAPSYALTVRQLSQLRQAHVIGKQLSELGDSAELEKHIRQLIELTKDALEFDCHISQAMSDAIDLLDAKTATTTTGLRDLDEALGGLHNGDLIVVGARPAMGKTAFMLNLALSATVPVGVISGEQGRDQIGLRFIAIDKHISLHRMRTGKLDDQEWSRINDAINAAKSKNIWLNDKPAPSIDDVIRQARSWAYEKKIGVLMIDYLQKIQGGDGDNVRERVGNVTARSKDLARELNIPVVLLAQIKREVESRPMGPNGLGRMPGMADLSESGIIEQEADSIMTLYRPEVYEPAPTYKGIAYVNICKNRHGPCGYKSVSWRGEYLQFGDLAKNEAAYSDQWSAA